MIPTELSEKRDNIKQRLTQVQSGFDVSTIKQELKEKETLTQAPDFWNNPIQAQEISQQASALKKMLETWQSIKDTFEYLEELSGIATESDLPEFTETLSNLDKNLQIFEIQILLSEEYDQSNAILSLNVGNGGQDAEDFTAMLYRMYLRFCEERAFSVSILDESTTEDGLKSATIQIKGPYAYGYIKGEQGVHRLIRQSPFNAKGLRQTSFARVDVIPEIEEQTIDIEEKDLRIDVFRASGNGGQSVNTTDSAVRITYIPLGISVSCQNEKSQLQNKQTAMKILQSRLLQLQKAQHTQELKDIRGDVMENSFGSQVRTFTLHPYKMVKDHRTNYEESNPQKVLDGYLDGFVNSYLQFNAQEK